jgi:hypothetical protein
MISIVERYLAAGRATGFELTNTEYLLRSFALWAAQRGETHIRSESAIAWASQTASVAQRDARLKTTCLFARYLRSEDPRHELPSANHFGYHTLQSKIKSIFRYKCAWNLCPTTRKSSIFARCSPTDFPTVRFPDCTWEIRDWRKFLG